MRTHQHVHQPNPPQQFRPRVAPAATAAPRTRRLLVPEVEIAERLFLVEATTPYLPSRWFGLADAVLRGAERTIEVRIGAPLEIDVKVVREGGGAPVVGTVVELLRPWPKSPEVTLRTNFSVRAPA